MLKPALITGISINALCPIAFCNLIKMSAECQKVFKIVLLINAEKFVLNLYNISLICNLIEVLDIDKYIVDYISLVCKRILGIHNFFMD